MKTTAKYIFILLFFILNCYCVTAKNNTDTSRRFRDSVQDNFISDQTKQLSAFNAVRINDSIKRAELENKIEALKTPDNLKKIELLNELAQLKSIDSIRIALKKQKIDSLKNVVAGFPIAPFIKDTLFIIYNKSGSLSPKERADAITDRIKNLGKNYFFKADSLSIVNAENSIDIVLKDEIIISISENDALWQNTTKENLANTYKAIIGKAVMDYKKATSWQTLSKEISLALLVLLIIIVLISLIIWLSRYIKTKVEAQKNKLINGIKIKNYILFDATKQVNFFLFINRILKWFLILTTIYIALPILFSLFPWTKGFADTLVSYFTNPIKHIAKAIWSYMPNFITIVIILIVFRYFLKGVHYLKNEVARGALVIPGFYADWANPTFQILRVLILAFMLVVIFPYLPGSDSPVFQGVSVFLGVLFTFGSSGSLSNVVAGLVITYMRAFKIGDRVKIGDITGDIIEKTLLVTRIRTIKNEVISLPNSNVMNSHTINYSSDAVEKGLILYTTVTIGYDTPWRDIHQALIDAALRTEFILKEPAPFILQTSLDDFYVSYQLNAYTKEPNLQHITYSDLHQNIQDCCNEVGIEILSPHYKAARDGNTSGIPFNYLPKDYVAPSFNVQIKKETNK